MATFAQEDASGLRIAASSQEEFAVFIEQVWEEGGRLYRDFPWRNIDDSYHILVSEVMLQQTQVSRVINYWERFLGSFPTIDALAAADTALVLEHWQGLGYNRRALSLKRTAEICSAQYKGTLPKSFEELLALPGIGQATAAGVYAFAYNLPAIYLETNVRTVFIHEFFSERDQVKDTELYPLVEESCSQDNPRAWYYALLDYGAHLKQVATNPSRKSAHYSKQSSFEGSRRQKRAEILRCVLASPGITMEELFVHLNEFEENASRRGLDPLLFDSIVSDMIRESFFCKEGDSLLA